MIIKPSQGDIWWFNLDPVVGHEQAKKRPCLIISDDKFNHSIRKLVVIMPLTSQDKQIPWHIPATLASGHLSKSSFIMCEQIRTVSIERIDGNLLGRINELTLQQVQSNICLIFSMFGHRR